MYIRVSTNTNIPNAPIILCFAIWRQS